jgi:hypothetical protein
MDATEVFCKTMKGLSLSFARVDYIRDPSSFWLCEVKFCAKPLITASIRRSRNDRVEIVHIPVEDFFHRIHKAFAVVSVFWHKQVVLGTQWWSLSPVSETVQRECSWIFGIDTANKGSLLLRMLLREELGCYSLAKTPDLEIRDCIVERARSLPVFQKIMDHTREVYWASSITS